MANLHWTLNVCWWLDISQFPGCASMLLSFVHAWEAEWQKLVCLPPLSWWNSTRMHLWETPQEPFLRTLSSLILEKCKARTSIEYGFESRFTSATINYSKWLTASLNYMKYSCKYDKTSFRSLQQSVLSLPREIHCAVILLEISLITRRNYSFNFNSCL